MKRAVAWTLIGLGGFVLVFALMRVFGLFDPKGTGSLFFAASILLLVGWIIGDF